MFAKETKDKKYRDDLYRAVNFPIDENGNPFCPNGKRFYYMASRPIKGNKYGRKEELYQCEDCTDCPHKPKCCKRKGNRIVRMRTSSEWGVDRNSRRGAGKSEQHSRCITPHKPQHTSGGAFGEIKWNHSYTRARRRGLEGLILEISLISGGFNLHKYQLQKLAGKVAA